MRLQDNEVFQISKKIAGFKTVTPEETIYMYAKLLMMSESQLKAIFGDQDLEDIECARRWFSDKSLVIGKIKTGITLLINAMQQNDANVEEKREFFTNTITSPNFDASSENILQAAYDNLTIPLVPLFSEDATFNAVMECRRKLLNKTGDASEEKREDTLKPPSLVDPSIDEDESTKIPVGPVPKTAEQIKKEEAEKLSEEAKRFRESLNRKKAKLEKKEEIKIPHFLKSDKSPECEEDDIDDFDFVDDEDTNSLEKLSSDMRQLTSVLLSEIIGQDAAVMKFVKGYYQGELHQNFEGAKRPRHTFFLFGPPGVGKTFLADTFMKYEEEEHDIPSKTYRMSEHTGRDATDIFIGTLKTYSNSKPGGLTTFVKENPRCIIFFDEIEKTTPDVIKIFLHILGDGEVQDRSTEEIVSFRDATLIFGSNVGKMLYEDETVNLETVPERVIINAIEKDEAFPKEIVSRVSAGTPILFNRITTKNLVEMINRKFEKVVEGMEKTYNAHINYSSNLPLMFIFNRGAGIDARVATSKAIQFLEFEVLEILKHRQNNSNFDKVREVNIDIDITGVDPLIENLFKTDYEEKVLFFTSEKEEVIKKIKADNITIIATDSVEEFNKYILQNVSAVYIDPFLGDIDDSAEENEKILSVSDYNTQGVRLYWNVIEKFPEMPLYILERDIEFSEIDRITFFQEGATGIIKLDLSRPESFSRELKQSVNDRYMESKANDFIRQGFVVAYNTKQIVSEDESKIDVVFYDLKKRMAVDLDDKDAYTTDETRPKITFDDVIGAEDAKKELRRFVEYIKNPKEAIEQDREPARGILLYGPPGTGKTLLAKALAGETKCAFFETSAAEFKDSLVGSSEKNIKKIFDRARAAAPAIIFIDEIDAIGRQRTGREMLAHEENMLAALIKQMQGFVDPDPLKPVFIIAASNFSAGDSNDIGKLDEALVDRFENKIRVDLPNESERIQFIEKFISKLKKQEVTKECIKNIAERTPRMNLRVLGNILKNAKRDATDEGKPVTDSNILTSLENYKSGELKEHSEEYYHEVSIHETGHAYVAYMGGDKPTYVTIESRGDFGGYMQHANTENKESFTREEILTRIRTSMAGRAAEQVFFGKEKSLNTGASSDLENATSWAFRLISSYAMEEGMYVVLSKEEILKSTLAATYIEKINAILAREMENAIELITEGKDTVEALANELCKENRITGDRFEELIENYKQNK